MQLFVRTLSGRTAVVEAGAQERLDAVTARLSARALGAPADRLRLVCNGRELDAARTVGELQLGAGSTMHAALRLLGGAPTHVKIISQRTSEQSVVIEMEEGERMSAVKLRLQAATGVPAAEQKIRLGGYNQMVMIDTACNILVGSSGITKAVQDVDSGLPVPDSFK